MVEKTSKLSQYKYMVTIIVGAFAVCIILGIVVIRPLINSLKETNSSVKEQKVVLEKLEANLENLKHLESKKTELEQKNQKVLSALPENKDVPRLFVQLERIASGAGVQINNVSEATSADTGESSDTSVIMPLYYQITGNANDYQSLKNALQSIEEGLRLITVEKITVQGSQTGKSLTVNLTVKTFSRGQQ